MTKAVNKSWIIWDCVTGSVDGYYFNKQLAQAVLERLKQEGCASVMLCEIHNKNPEHGIPDHLWHASNGVGFFGRSTKQLELPL